MDKQESNMQKAFGKIYFNAERIEKLPVVLPTIGTIANLAHNTPKIGDFLLQEYVLPGDHVRYTTVSAENFAKHYAFEDA
jgi:hypothetical protein